MFTVRVVVSGGARDSKTRSYTYRTNIPEIEYHVLLAKSRSKKRSRRYGRDVTITVSIVKD